MRRILKHALDFAQAAFYGILSMSDCVTPGLSLICAVLAFGFAIKLWQEMGD